MRDFFWAILGASWIRHIYVLRGRPDSPWIPAFNNLSIAAAHFGIILVLWQVMRKRKESEFRWVALLFGMFNGIRCLTQSLGVWPFWHPAYELHSGFRAATAVLAVATAVALIRSLPALRRLPSAADLEREIGERRIAEEAALEKEERLRNFVESVQDYAMYMVDLKGVIQSWNSGAERMTGYSAEEIMSTGVRRNSLAATARNFWANPRISWFQSDCAKSAVQAGSGSSNRRSGLVRPPEASACACARTAASSRRRSP